VRIALGVLVSNGYRADTDFLFGRPDRPTEGFFALAAHVQTGAANRALPDDRQITGCRTILSRKFPTDVARNEVCAAVLEGDEDYLLFLDADMVHPVDLVEKLLAHQKPVITARYHLKKAPFAAIAYVKHRTQEGPHRYASIHFGKGCFEIERGGAGALLIHRSVLQGIYDRIGHNWFRYQRGPEPPHDFSVSEDFWFYQQSREAGFSCWCDWDIDVPHIGPMAVDASWNVPFLNTQVSEYANPEQRDVVLANTIIRGYDGGMVLGDGTEHEAHIPEYELTAGER
jgi:glycosyltransferase involved in cell wall biosynthesis